MSGNQFLHSIKTALKDIAQFHSNYAQIENKLRMQSTTMNDMANTRYTDRSLITESERCRQV